MLLNVSTRAGRTRVSQFLRTWALSRYPGFRYHDHMVRNLNIPESRPAYRASVEDYTPHMLPAVDQVVAAAQASARKVPPLRSATSEGTRAVVYALRESTKPTPDTRYARR